MHPLIRRNKYRLNKRLWCHGVCHSLFNVDLMPSIHQGTIKQTIKHTHSRVLAHDISQSVTPSSSV